MQGNIKTIIGSLSVTIVLPRQIAEKMDSTSEDLLRYTINKNKIILERIGDCKNE